MKAVTGSARFSGYMSKRAAAQPAKPDLLDARDREQSKAFASIENTWKNDSRARFIAPTGFGKTFVDIRLIQRRNKVVVLVPSVALVDQFLTDFQRQCANTKRRLGRLASTKPADTNDRIIGCASAEDVRAFFRGEGKSILVSTYQSQRKIVRGCRGLELDLVIADESHRTAGKSDRPWSEFMTKLNSKKWLFQTATAKVFGENLKREEDLLSQDDESVYGPIAYKISAREATVLGIIQDFSIMVLADSEDLIPPDERKPPRPVRRDLKKEHRREPTTYEMALVAGQLWHAWKWKHRKLLLYANRIDDAKFYADLVVAVGDILRKKDSKFPVLCRPAGGAGGNVHAIGGAVTTRARKDIFEQFETSKDMQVIVSVRTLAEGVSLNTADVVGFLAKRESKIDLTQIIGRVRRLHPSKGNRNSIVMMPAIVSHKEEFETRGELGAIRELVTSLAEEDDSWQIVLSNLLEGNFAYLADRKDIEPKLFLVGPARIAEFAEKLKAEVFRPAAMKPEDSAEALLTWIREHGRSPKSTATDPSEQQMGKTLIFLRHKHRDLLPSELRNGMSTPQERIATVLAWVEAHGRVPGAKGVTDRKERNVRHMLTGLRTNYPDLLPDALRSTTKTADKRVDELLSWIEVHGRNPRQGVQDQEERRMGCRLNNLRTKRPQLLPKHLRKGR